MSEPGRIRIDKDTEGELAELAALLSERADCLKWLRFFEFSGYNNVLHEDFCKECRNTKSEGHAPDCDYAAMIARLEKP